MKKLSIKKLSDYLGKVVEHNIQSSIMIWGAPGIGKSSVVEAVARNQNLELIDLRISQLAPTDLRGIPVPKDGKACWYPPEFLPTSGKGILFLDEINMAPPAVQGIAQQLILDRKVGSYKVPDGWFIWSAGNRKEDYAAVFDMPAPLANRFIHLEVKTGLDEFKDYALKNKVDDRIISFLNFRPNCLHKINKNSPSWPSPRSWVIGNSLLQAGLDLDPAIGEACASEFRSYCTVYKNLPDISSILSGNKKPIFPEDLSARYALTCALAVRAKNVKEVENAFLYIDDKGSMEWLSQCTYEVVTKWKGSDKSEELVDMITKNKKLLDVADRLQKLLAA
tara:strand:- start:2847 stop:3854 length:1008 start_codon:yes stop_codon:yes gene_type:complete